MEITGRQFRKGHKIAHAGGYIVLSEVHDKGDSMWCLYKQYDREGVYKGSWGSSFDRDKKYTRLV